MESTTDGHGIVIINSHPLIIEGLKTLVGKKLPSSTIHYDGDSLKAAEIICQENSINIAIVEIQSKDFNESGDIVAFFTSINIPVLAMSELPSFQSAKIAFDLGAQGYLSTLSVPEEFIKAINAVSNRETWISPLINSSSQAKTKPTVELSNQERSAVVLYASGLKLEAVARKMNVAPSTVKQYIERAKLKYQSAGKPIRTKTDMYRTFRDEGLIN